MNAEPRKGSHDDFAVLPIPAARGRVEVVGARGVFYSLRQGGQVLKRRRRAWPVVLKSGEQGSIRSAGWIPGFQRLYFDGRLVYQFGADVPRTARVLAFLPLALIALNLLIGGTLGIVLVIYNLYAIKNPNFPNPVRIAVPVLHTIAGVLVTIVASGFVPSS